MAWELSSLFAVLSLALALGGVACVGTSVMRYLSLHRLAPGQELPVALWTRPLTRWGIALLFCGIALQTIVIVARLLLVNAPS